MFKIFKCAPLILNQHSSVHSCCCFVIYVLKQCIHYIHKTLGHFGSSVLEPIAASFRNGEWVMGLAVRES